MKIIDTHIHTIFRPSQFFENYRLMGVEMVVTVAFYPIQPKHSGTLEDLFRWMIERETIRLQDVGISCKCAIGIHPRSIPMRLDSKIFDVIEEIIGKTSGLGEIGLEKGTKEEIDVLEKQLLIAKKHNDFPVVLHTPGKNKRAITRIMVELLESCEISNGIIDHVSLENIDLILNTKLYMGLTTQKGKLSIEDFIHIIHEYEDMTNRFTINSDLGIDIAYEYIVPKSIHYLVKENFDKAVIEAISYKNAENLFQLK